MAVSGLRVGGFLLTGIGGAIWLLVTPANEQYSGGTFRRYRGCFGTGMVQSERRLG